VTGGRACPVDREVFVGEQAGLVGLPTVVIQPKTCSISVRFCWLSVARMPAGAVHDGPCRANWSGSARSNCSDGIEGRPMSEYIFVTLGDSSANTRSVIARIARSK